MRHQSGHRVSAEWFKKWLVDYDLWFVSEGTVCLTENHKIHHLLHRGSVVFLRPDHVYSVEQDDGAERFSLSFFHFDILRDQDTASVTASDLEKIPTVMECHEPDFLEAICQRIHRLPLVWNNQGAPGEPLTHQHAGMLLKLLLADAYHQHFSHAKSEASSVNALRYRQILAVMAEIRKNPKHFSSVAELARFCKVSPDYVTKLFFKVFKVSPRDALINARVEKAKLFLSGSTLTISEIAEELGYKDIYFFSRQFRQRVGMPPSAYRNSLGEQT